MWGGAALQDLITLTKLHCDSCRQWRVEVRMMQGKVDHPMLDSAAFCPLQALEGMVQATQGEVEQHTQALQAVRMKLAPWERQMGEVRSRMGVATSERDLLHKAHAQAQERFKVSTSPS